MRTPRTLLIYSTLPLIGGNSTNTLTVAKEFRDLGWTVLVLTRHQTVHGLSLDNIKLLEEMGCDVRVLTTRDGIYGLSTLRAFLWVRQRGQGAVFITLCVGYISPLLSLIGRFKKSIFYLITHEEDRKRIKFLTGYKHLITDFAAVSPVTLAPLGKFIGRKTAVHWLPQFSTFSSNGRSESKRRPDRSLTFGFLGALTAGKGVDLLIDAWAKLEGKADLRIAGNGPLRSRVEEAAAASHDRPGRIFYDGAFDAANRDAFLVSFFESIDYLIVPSANHHEGIPTVILEALSCGIPSLASNLGGTACFDLDWLKPCDPHVVRLFDLEKLSITVQETIARGFPTEEDRKACTDYYRLWFSNQTVLQRWIDITQ